MENTMVFVDFTNEQQKERMTELFNNEFVQEHINNGTKYILFDMDSGNVHMVVGNDNIVYTDEQHNISYVGINDIDIAEDKKDND